MEEARAVLARLERIEALRRASAPAADLLAELAALAREASAWAEREDDPRARTAAAALAARAPGLAPAGSNGHGKTLTPLSPAPATLAHDAPAAARAGCPLPSDSPPHPRSR